MSSSDPLIHLADVKESVLHRRSGDNALFLRHPAWTSRKANTFHRRPPSAAATSTLLSSSVA